MRKHKIQIENKKQKKKVQQEWKEDTEANIALKNKELEQIDKEIERLKNLGKVKAEDKTKNKEKKAEEQKKKTEEKEDKEAVTSLKKANTSALNGEEERYKKQKIEIIDATVNTVLQGMLVEEAVVKKNTGATFEETVKYVNLVKETGRIFFTINGMDY